MKLTCLLPVRNGEEELPEYLAGVGEFADDVIALDDGSTDATLRLLRASPLVSAVLTNPVRPSYAGWDDYANRTRLLAAAEASAPDWVIWIDADERLESSDAAVIRDFLQHEARRDTAYCLEVLRAIDDLEHFDKCAFWVPRLYAWRPGLSLKPLKLHLDLIPREFDATAVRRTSLRLLHKAGMDARRRQSRYDKYSESDPDREWLREEDYQRLLQAPRLRKPVLQRAASAPVLID